MELAERVQRISLSPTGAVLQQAEQMLAAGLDVVNFGVGEPDFPTPDFIKRAAVQALEQNRTRYTPTAGIRALREAVCRWHREQFGTSYSPEECIITVGGKHALFNALQVLVNSGDAVLLPSPYWVSYPDMIRYAGGIVQVVPTAAEEGFLLDPARLEQAVTANTRGIIVNSPNNPTGAVVPAETFERLVALCRRRRLWLITDECYSHFLYDGLQPFSAASLPGAREHVLVAGSLSKTFAMTGWRIGFALGPVPVIEAMTRVQSQATSNATSIAQYAALEALRQPLDSVRQMLAAFAHRRDYLLERLRRIPGLVCAVPQGAFYAFPDVRRTPRMRSSAASGPMTTLQLATLLLEQERVAVVAGEAFGAPGFLRISYATSLEAIEKGLERLHRFLTSCH